MRAHQVPFRENWERQVLTEEGRKAGLEAGIGRKWLG